MDTQDFFKQHRQEKERSRLAYEVTVKRYKVAGMPLVECRDAKMKTGRYPNMLLSDIFIFAPDYLEYLVNHEKVEDELKAIAKEVMKHQSHGADSVSREIAMG
jgi:hypothetical protein